MPKRQSNTNSTSPSPLFAPARRNRRLLILPRFLAEESRAQASRDAGLAYEAAHNILIKWADLESDGTLDKKETSLNANFLNDIFGNALGYTPLDQAADGKHTLERELHIPNVGPVNGALGTFPANPDDPALIAIIELKGPTTDLDTHRSNGRTAVNQLFDYLNALPNTKWGILSNISTIRLYHKASGSQAYEEFTLQNLRHADHFAAFWTLLEKSGLFPSKTIPVPRADALLAQTGKHQKAVGAQFFEYSAYQRSCLITYLRTHYDQSLDQAIHIAQLLLDRVVFVAMAGSYGLISPIALDIAAFQIAPYSRKVNPRWQNFLDLFEALRTGHATLNRTSGFDHQLFKFDHALDSLQLDDSWSLALAEFCGIDYVNELPSSLLTAFFKSAVGAINAEFRDSTEHKLAAASSFPSPTTYSCSDEPLSIPNHQGLQ